MSTRLVLIESNTSGTGRLFARAAMQQGARPILLTDDPSRYKYINEEQLEVLQINTQDEDAIFDACMKLPAFSETQPAKQGDAV